MSTLIQRSIPIQYITCTVLYCKGILGSACTNVTLIAYRCMQIRAGQWMFEGEDLMRLERTHRGSHWHHGIDADVFLLQLCCAFSEAMPRHLLRAITDHFTVSHAGSRCATSTVTEQGQGE